MYCGGLRYCRAFGNLGLGLRTCLQWDWGTARGSSPLVYGGGLGVLGRYSSIEAPRRSLDCVAGPLWGVLGCEQVMRRGMVLAGVTYSWAS